MQKSSNNLETFSEIIISDTSCLIGLTNIGLLDVLRQLYNTVTITPEVANEYGCPLPEWIHIVAVKDTERLDSLRETLDWVNQVLLRLQLKLRIQY
jgi:predicted nucleic acid-binding protein